MSARLKRISLWILTVSGVLLLFFFLFRNYILHKVIDKAVIQIKERFDVDLKVKEASFSGIKTVNLYGITLIPFSGDTLLSADTVNVNVAFWSLTKGIIKLKMLSCSDVSVTASCRNGVCNYDSFIHQKKNVNRTVNSERNLALFFKQNLDRAFNLAPQKASLKNILLTYRNDTLQRSIRINEFESDESSLKGIAENLYDSTFWNCNGQFSQSRKILDLNIFPLSGTASTVPMINELTGITTGFDTANVSIRGYTFSNNQLTLNGKLSIEGFQLFHKKISDDTIKISSASFDYKFIADKTSLTLDSASTATLALINIHPFLKYSSSKEKEYTIKLHTDLTPANNFFSSLPQGVFDEVRDIDAEGSLQFDLSFKLNTSVPDSVEFTTSMKKEKFRIKKFGESNLGKMNGEFLHSVYERDRLMRNFMVGPSNPSFAPLETISLNVINSILTSEDGNFFFHNGFNEDAFRKSIAANYKAGRFVRGGSTISMQLVKNVFLNRKKTIARKAEEALIVWIIETNNITSKDRMLEVYLNIVEFGPNIYGIGEASSFYFNKPPSDITLPEGIFISSLLPHPKWFKYSFDTLGNLKPYLAGYYRVVSDFMLRKNLITQMEHDTLRPSVTLTGPARELVVPTDTVLVEDENIFGF